MYSLIKSNVSKEDWTKWRDSLIEEAIDKQNRNILTYIFTQEEMWDRYINYIKKNPDQYLLEDTPKAVRNLYQDEFIKLYGNCARQHFKTHPIATLIRTEPICSVSSLNMEEKKKQMLSLKSRRLAAPVAPHLSKNSQKSNKPKTKKTA